MSQLTLDETKVYNDAVAFAELIWDDVTAWNQFARGTVGNQLVRAADSIGANIAEGYGRFHFGERIHFLYYARGSLYECKHWVTLAGKRNLCSPEIVHERINCLSSLALELNAYIKDKREFRKSYK